MKKALIVTTVSGFVPQFEMENVSYLQSIGYEVHYACNYHTPVYGNDNSRLDGTGIIRHQIDFLRSPFTLKNIMVYKKLKKLMQDHHFDLIHCHTPMGGVIARLAANVTGTGPIVYTAHGFHFYKGAPLINNILYRTMESFLAKYTDGLITINKEDYEAANRFRMKKNGKVFYVPGIGVESDKIGSIQVDRQAKRKEFGISNDDFMMITVGELTKRKNHEVVIRALVELRSNTKLVICGTGTLDTYLRYLVQKLDLEDKVVFAGYRRDVSELLHASDCFVFPSLQEGLSVALMEAMAAGKPIICSNIRGNSDLIEHGIGGYLIKSTNINDYAKAFDNLINNNDLCNEMGKNNLERIKKFDVGTVRKKMTSVYESVTEKIR